MFGGSYVGRRILAALAKPPQSGGDLPDGTASNITMAGHIRRSVRQWFNESWSSGLARTPCAAPEQRYDALAGRGAAADFESGAGTTFGDGIAPYFKDCWRNPISMSIGSSGRRGPLRAD